MSRPLKRQRRQSDIAEWLRSAIDEAIIEAGDMETYTPQGEMHANIITEIVKLKERIQALEDLRNWLQGHGL